MTLDQARKMVEEALRERKRFGKHFGVEDMPPEFLDALVIVFDAPSDTVVKLEAELKAKHDEIVLLNRQLGAAKARETKLRADFDRLVHAEGDKK